MITYLLHGSIEQLALLGEQRIHHFYDPTGMGDHISGSSAHHAQIQKHGRSLILMI